jgi:hypothetical protein
MLQPRAISVSSLAADHLAVYAGNVGIHGTNTAQSGEYPMVATGERVLAH